MTDGDRDRVIAAEVIAKAWKDEAYRERLVAEPNAVLAAAGINPGGKDHASLVEEDVEISELCCESHHAAF